MIVVTHGRRPATSTAPSCREPRADSDGGTRSCKTSREPRTSSTTCTRPFSQRLKLARRSGRALTLTTKGRAALDDPATLRRTTARGLLPAEPFRLAVGELTLALLVGRTGVPAATLQSVVTDVVLEERTRDTSSGAPPEAQAIDSAIHDTTNLLRALNLSAASGDWSDRSYALSELGHATAVETLHYRSIGPRSSPLG